MAENSSRTFGGQDVAVFIDFENIYISVLAEYDVNPDFEALIEKAEDFGRVSVAQAYADWTPYSHYINSLHAYQIDPMYVPAYHYGEGGKQKGGAIKNSVDMFLCINAMKMLYSHPNIQTFVLVTGDRDFVPLIKTIREFGKRAVVIGVAGAASAHLAQSADEFFFYHQITDNLRPPEKERPKIRDPYETLVEAVKLARQRGYVATLASLKLLMAELMGEFDESKYKDGRGKPIQKFKDFVKEAERRNKVKLFSTGTINEVFLPNEDPRKTSRFVEELLPPAEPVDEVDEPEEAEEESKVEVEVSKDQWKLFIQAMSPVEGAVPFVRVFDVLRGLRNQGLLDLSNKEVKGMIIKAIHLNLLNRSNRGRGRRTFYQLTVDPKVLGQYVELPAPSPVADHVAVPAAGAEAPITEASIMEAQITREMDTETRQQPVFGSDTPAESTSHAYGMDQTAAAESQAEGRSAWMGMENVSDEPASAYTGYADAPEHDTQPRHAHAEPEERASTHESLSSSAEHTRVHESGVQHAHDEPLTHSRAHEPQHAGAGDERTSVAETTDAEPQSALEQEPEVTVDDRKPRRGRSAPLEEAASSEADAVEDEPKPKRGRAAPAEDTGTPSEAGVVEDEPKHRRGRTAPAEEAAASGKTPATFEPLAATTGHQTPPAGPVKRERATPPRTRRGRGKPPAAAKYVTYEMGESALDAPSVEDDRETTQPPAEAQSEE